MPRVDGDRWLADLPPTRRQTLGAATVAGVSLIGFALVAPFAGKALPELNAFFPSLDAIVFVTDLITAILLFAQFSIFRSRALLVLASGYLMTALIVVPHALTFAGAFSPTGLLGAGIQTGSWLFIFWHAGFAVALLAYSVLRVSERRSDPPATHLPMIAVGQAAACTFALVGGLTWLATVGSALLPPIILDQTRIGPQVTYYIAFTILIYVTALCLLAFRRSVLDQWLMVVALITILELVYSGLIPTVRFSAGFYTGRLLSLVTASLVLIVLLAETTRVQIRLARSNLMLKRERDNKLMNLEAVVAFISHQIRQPVMAITSNSAAATRFLQRNPPDLSRALATLADLNSAVDRTDEVFESVRALFGKPIVERQPVNINETVLGALRIVGEELRDRQVTASVDRASDLPLVAGHEGQLQEVFINVFHNAVEAMDDIGGDRILAIRTRYNGNAAVIIEIEDNGSGIDKENAEKIFDPFVTTKPTGMGLGLTICRMIVDRHGGQLSASSVNPRGTIVRVALPTSASR